LVTRWAVCSLCASSHYGNLWVLPLERPTNPFPLIGTGASERNGQFSPDGRWVAYDCNDTGSYEVYAQAFSKRGEPGARWQVSRNGGSQPRWRHHGKELFYISNDGTLPAVVVETSGSTFTSATPRALFAAPLLMINDFSSFYDATPDGKFSPRQSEQIRPQQTCVCFDELAKPAEVNSAFSDSVSRACKSITYLSREQSWHQL
jgi:hypothetical protein